MSKSFAISVWLVLVVLGFWSGCGIRADLADPQIAAPNKAPGAAPQGRWQEQRQRYDELYREWRSVVGRLRSLDVAYQNASARRRDQLRTQYEPWIAQGSELEQQLIEAAVSSYAANPEANQDTADLLVGAAHLLLEGEEYEQSLRIAQLLLDQGFSHPELIAVAGMAAFVTCEFDSAEKLLQRANQRQTLSGIAARYSSEIDYYKSAWQREQQLRSAERSAGDLPLVLLKTTQGEIELELFENEAPNTVANFVYLIEQRFYDGSTFHRVLPQQMAQAGCPKGDGSGGPRYRIPCECYRDDHRLHFRGSLAMEHSGRDTGGSQFYLAFVPLGNLDGKHTVFGRIVRGLGVLAKLQRRDPPAPDLLNIRPVPDVSLPPADKILEAKVLRKRDHPYRPSTWPLRGALGCQAAYEGPATRA